MPFNELNRRESWPPTILHLEDVDLYSRKEIDDDPFQYFLTSAEEVDEDLSAGIEDSAVKDIHIREISPASLLDTLLESPEEYESYEQDEFGQAIGIPLSLREFTSSHLSNNRDKRVSIPKRRNSSPSSEKSPPSISLGLARGRRTAQASPTLRARGRRQTRSVSAHRPHSWHEPSPDVWSIEEEDETVYNEDVPPLSLDEPEEEEAKDAIAKDATPRDFSHNVLKAKLKKKVRWALP